MKVGYLVTFVLGAVTGGYVSWMYAKKKYEAIAQEEIDSVKEAFSEKEKNESDISNDMTETITSKKVQPDESSVSLYSSIIKDNRYSEMEECIKTNRPYIITPDEFGEINDYENITLIYFADGIITDDNYDLVDDDDVESTVGKESLNHFGEYEDDSVFVRNDAYKCDYEILKDSRNYDDVMKLNYISYNESRRNNDSE